MDSLAPYRPYITEYSKHQSTIGIRCDRCGEIIDCYCDEVFRDTDFFFECPICNYSDWIGTTDIANIAKQIKKEMMKNGFIFDL